MLIQRKQKNSLGRYGNLSDEQVWLVIFFQDLQRERHMPWMNINPFNGLQSANYIKFAIIK